MISFSASAVVLIQASHQDNLERADDDEASVSEEEVVLVRFDSYYKKKGIRLLLVDANSAQHAGAEPLRTVYEGRTDPPRGNYRVMDRL